jgi:hypothetical protein
VSNLSVTVDGFPGRHLQPFFSLHTMSNEQPPPPETNNEPGDLLSKLKSKINPNFQKPIAITFVLVLFLLLYRLFVGKINFTLGNI